MNNNEETIGAATIQESDRPSLTFENILRACASGEMPWVASLIDIPDRERTGRILTIKGHLHRGIAVVFEGNGNEVWFWEKPEAPGHRSLSQLTLYECPISIEITFDKTKCLECGQPKKYCLCVK